MNKIRSVISRLEAFFARENWTNSPTFQRLLAEYGQVCEELNARLSKCEALLATGRKGEAILAAEKSPSLFEVIPPLQGPGVVHFFEACNFYQLPPPPVLKTAVFQSLQNALEEESTLPDLLALFRGMSRSGASEEKVLLLRRIVALQPNDPEWAGQLHHAELAFIPQVIEGAKRDIQKGDWDALAEKEEMFASPSWRAAVPDVVMEKIRRTLDEVRNREFRGRAEEVLQEVEAALAADSFPEFKVADDHWRMLCEVDCYLPDEEESRRYSLVAEHFAAQVAAEEEEQAYASAVMRMRLYMEGGEEHAYERTMDLYRPLAELGRPVPTDILDFVHRAGEEVRRRKARETFKSFVILMSLGGLLLGGGFWWYQKEHGFRQWRSALDVEKDVAAAREWQGRLDQPWFRFLKKDKERIQTLKEESEELAEEERDFLRELEEWKAEYVTEESVVQGKTGEEEWEDLREKAETKTSKEQVMALGEEARRFREELRSRNTEEMRSLLAELLHLDRRFGEVVQERDWNELAKVLDRVREIQEHAKTIVYFDETVLDAQGRKLLEPKNWRVRKHVAQYKAITHTLDQVEQRMAEEEQLAADGWPALFREVSAWGEEYCQDEEEEEGRSLFRECRRQVPGMMEAKALRERIKTLRKAYGEMERTWRLRQKFQMLEKLSVEFWRELSRGAWEAAGDAAAEYRVAYEAFRSQDKGKAELSQGEEAIWKKFGEMESPAKLEEEWKGQKEVEEIMLALRKDLPALQAPERRERYLQRLRKGQKSYGKAGKAMGDLLAQMESLGVALEWQWQTKRLDLPTALVTSSTPCLMDLWRYVNWKAQDRKFFKVVQDTLTYRAERYKEQAKSLGSFSFQDAQGEHHEWIFGKRELRFMGLATSSRKQNLRFVIGNWEFSVMDQTVNILYKSPYNVSFNVSERYSNCAFPEFGKQVKFSKNDITKTDLEYGGVLLDPMEILKEIEAMEPSIFSREYVELVKTQSSCHTWIELHGGYMAMLLAPWLQVAEQVIQPSPSGEGALAKSENAAIFAFPELAHDFRKIKVQGDKLQEILDQITGVRDSEQRVSYVDDLTREDFQPLDFSSMERIAGSLNAYYTLLDKVVHSSFACVGLAWGQRQEIFLNPDADGTDGELWAFFPAPRGTQRVGRKRGGKVELDKGFWETYRDDLVLLVTPGPQVDSAQWLQEYQASLPALEEGSPCLPSLFPVNAK